MSPSGAVIQPAIDCRGEYSSGRRGALVGGLHKEQREAGAARSESLVIAHEVTARDNWRIGDVERPGHVLW